MSLLVRATKRTPATASMTRWISRNSGGSASRWPLEHCSLAGAASGPAGRVELRRPAQARVIYQPAGPGQVFCRGHELRLRAEQVERVGRDHALDVGLRHALLEDRLGEDPQR